jgi:AmmeMemoRadiSam system protein A
MFTPEEQRQLLRIARDSIASAVLGKRMTPGSAAHPQGRLAEHCGAFVTLRLNKQLRGCIGYIEAGMPLAHVVAEVAEKAAMEDPRFMPLTPEEADQVEMEISVLSPLRLAARPEEVEVGKHGILLQLGENRGLLLPQVATEYHWDRETFLDNTARKAGLPRNAWRDPDAKIFLFSAELVKEE